MKKLKAVLCLVLCLALAGCMLTACGSGSSSKKSDSSSGNAETLKEGATDEEITAFITKKSSNKDKIVIKYASTSADLNGQSYLRAARQFLIRLKEQLGDKIEIQMYMNSTFGGSADAILGGLQQGTFQMTDWPCGSFSEYTKAFEPLDIPYLFTSNDETYEFLKGDAGDLMKETCIKDTQIRPLYYGIIGMRQMTNSKREIKTPDDLKGLKMRVQQNPMHIKIMENFGCSTATISFSELFTSLQQGVVDGQENPIETIYNSQYYQVQKYMTITNHLSNVGVVACSQKWYDSQDEEVQKAIDKAAKDAQEYSIKDLNKNEKKIVKKLSKKMTVTELSDKQMKAFEDKSKEIWPDLMKEVGEDYCKKVLDAGGVKYE